MRVALLIVAVLALLAVVSAQTCASLSGKCIDVTKTSCSAQAKLTSHDCGKDAAPSILCCEAKLPTPAPPAQGAVVPASDKTTPGPQPDTSCMYERNFVVPHKHPKCSGSTPYRVCTGYRGNGGYKCQADITTLGKPSMGDYSCLALPQNNVNQVGPSKLYPKCNERPDGNGCGGSNPYCKPLMQSSSCYCGN